MSLKLNVKPQKDAININYKLLRNILPPIIYIFVTVALSLKYLEINAFKSSIY